MTTTKDLIKFLKTLPSDTKVEVLESYSMGFSFGTEFVPLELDKYSDNCEHFSNTKTLYLGCD